MKFTYFNFENFKGIAKGTLDLAKNPDSRVFALVGLNESGKTTILEAINYFAYKRESLLALDLDSYVVEDIHSLIPINKRDNFNGFIIIKAGLEFDEDDISAIKKHFFTKDINLTYCDKKISFEQKYFFKNSIHIKENDKRHWVYDFKGKIGKTAKTVRDLNNAQALLVFDVIKERIPSILYFPNFLFEFPERIYLEDTVDDAKHKYYQTIIQDVLDSLKNNTNIQEHLIRRIQSKEENEKRNLTTLIGKMQKQLTEVIFTKWNQIFHKEILKTEIILYYGTDEKGAYLEFNIKDDVDTYRIIERSLGFRWFFVYILLTQFRNFRKQFKNVFFLFDEPASNLHPSAQTELLKSFEQLPKVLYTTHSHYLINPKWLENTFVIKNEAIDYDKEEKFMSKNTDIKISKYRDFATNYPNQTNYFQPILEVLDYRPTNLELVPNVIVTEGKNDFYIYNYFQQLNPVSDTIKIVPGVSANNLESIISLYLGWGRNFIVLLDSDRKGVEQKNRYLDLFGKSLEDRIITYQDIKAEWANTEIEDLFSKNDKLNIQKLSYPEENTYNKKLFTRAVQELYVKNENYNLSEETSDNINFILQFLRNKIG